MLQRGLGMLQRGRERRHAAARKRASVRNPLSLSRGFGGGVGKGGPLSFEHLLPFLSPLLSSRLLLGQRASLPALQTSSTILRCSYHRLAILDRFFF